MNTFDPLPSVGISPRNTIAMAKKFCTGSLDKESWIHATSLYPELHEKAMQLILRLQFNRNTVHKDLNHYPYDSIGRDCGDNYSQNLYPDARNNHKEPYIMGQTLRVAEILLRQENRPVDRNSPRREKIW
ncbi:hypothetical protein RRG08_006421 [Elysia crispata]|uniref:Uncharacterized protein n=1 Tax=Elysia crispata TaxID=231223 RepID=A0AAE0ZYL8_9GAST|nr:hypothetical protein RRG08_006421 [Elysia crispata]